MLPRITLYIVLLSFHALLVCSQILRMMTFNVWKSGTSVENGLLKIEKHIKAVDPDVVAIQEITDEPGLYKIKTLLGEEWSWTRCSKTRETPDVAILTRGKIIDLCLPTSRAIGVKILTQAGIPILVWSAHLNHRLYGPHAAQNKLVTSADQIINGEYQSGRVKNVQEILENEETKQWISMGNSVIIAGDFNCPSHLDWIEENKHIHGGWAVEWPVTKTLEQAGFSDSFRIIYPNVVDEPGFSWSPIHKFNKDWDYAIIPEPQDRLDFIFYKGGIQPINSSLYAGSEPLRIIQRDGQHKMNDYPSDHYALITDFVLPK